MGRRAVDKMWQPAGAPHFEAGGTAVAHRRRVHAPPVAASLLVLVSAAPAIAADLPVSIVQSAACAPVGHQPPDLAPRVVPGQYQKMLYNAGQQINVDIQGFDSVSVGQRFFIRRAMAFKGAPRAQFTIGQVTIVEVAPSRAVARIDSTCDAVAVGDHLEPYAEPVLPIGVDRSDPTGQLEADAAMTVSYGVDGHTMGGGRDFMLASRRSAAVEPGTRFAVFHKKHASVEHDEPFAEAIVVANDHEHLLLRITEARDAVATGDRLVMRVGGTMSSATAIVDAQPKAIEEEEQSSAEARRRAAAQAYSFDELYFDLNGEGLKAEAAALLDRAVVVLKQHADLNVEVEGYTCDIGTLEYNMALGERRALAVRDYLVEHGIAERRLSIVSFGEEHAKYDNADEETRKLNRRAALVVNVHTAN